MLELLASCLSQPNVSAQIHTFERHVCLLSVLWLGNYQLDASAKEKMETFEIMSKVEKCNTRCRRVGLPFGLNYKQASPEHYCHMQHKTY